MKYEEIEVGKTYIGNGSKKIVKFKYDPTKMVLATIGGDLDLYIWHKHEYEMWEPVKYNSELSEQIETLKEKAKDLGLKLTITIE